MQADSQRRKIRNAALHIWPKFLVGKTGELLRIQDGLRKLGCDGCLGNPTAESIITSWKDAGWIAISPSGYEIRLTTTGENQMHSWQQEDHLWVSGITDRQEPTIPTPNMKRDSNLIHLILREVVDGTPPAEMKNYSEELIIYNSALLVQDGLVDGETISDGNSQVVSILMRQLTNRGHYLLEKLNSDTVPKATMKKTTDNTKAYALSIFISHSAKDDKIAKALVELLRASLNLAADKIRCTSVDGYRLPAGAHTTESLRQEVLESQAFVAIITPSSIASTFVMFELGARWGASKHLVPLLAGGAGANLLRGPLSNFNALRCDQLGQVHQLIEELAKALSIKEKTSPAAYSNHIQILMSASKEDSADTHTTTSHSPLPMPVAQQTELTDNELEVIKLFVNAGNFRLQDAQVAKSLEHHPLIVSQLLEQLAKKELLHRLRSIGGIPSHKLTTAGRDFLISKNLIPDTRIPN